MKLIFVQLRNWINMSILPFVRILHSRTCIKAKWLDIWGCLLQYCKSSKCTVYFRLWMHMLSSEKIVTVSFLYIYIYIVFHLYNSKKGTASKCHVFFFSDYLIMWSLYASFTVKCFVYSIRHYHACLYKIHKFVFTYSYIWQCSHELHVCPKPTWCFF